MPANRLRISGLVRTANALRRELAGPLPAARREHWRQVVASILAKVDAIVARHGMTTRALPAPSLRAYQFLRGIDWERIPAGDPGRAVSCPPATLSWSGLGGVVERYLDQLARDATQAELDRIHRSIGITSRQIEGGIERRGAHAADLTPQARALRGWLAYFSDRENVAAYAQALSLAVLPISAAARSLRHKSPLVIHFRPTKYIYRLQPTPVRTLVHLPTPMICFDAGGFAAVAEMIRDRRSPARQHVLADMAAEPYQTIHAELESLGGIPEQSQGAYHDLTAAFDRVNAQFFAGRMARPHLTWSRGFTGRKMGHYDTLRDTVMVSSTLDQASVPQFVVDFLLYHELLHKHLGSRWVNGRCYGHTPEFRSLERRFPQFDEAEETLRRLARNILPEPGEK